MDFYTLLVSELPFETGIRVTNADWFGLSLLLVNLILLIILLYRNPLVLTSLFQRLLKNDQEKLYFSAPAIDSVDRLLLFVIYFLASNLTLYSFFDDVLYRRLGFSLFILPVVIVLFFLIPFFLTALLLDFVKLSRAIALKQTPLLFVFGLIQLPLGLVVFFESYDITQLRLLFLLSAAVVLVWLHLRVIRILLINGFSAYYIFMYFCTLEILPTAFFWVWLSRV
jgi:hypothetical protein